MADRVQQTEFLKLTRLEGNDRCVECQSLNANFVAVTFGVFLCSDCAHTLHQRVNLQIKNLDQESFSRIEMGTIREGGNLSFRQYMTPRVLGPMETRFTGKEAEFYQRKLAAEASGLTFVEQAPASRDAKSRSVSDGLTEAIRSVLTWSEVHVTTVLDKINKKVSENSIAKKTCQVIDASAKVYEAQVREHLISPQGFFHPVKIQMDRWGNFMDPPGLKSEAEMENLCANEGAEHPTCLVGTEPLISLEGAEPLIYSEDRTKQPIHPKEVAEQPICPEEAAEQPKEFYPRLGETEIEYKPR